ATPSGCVVCQFADEQSDANLELLCGAEEGRVAASVGVALGGRVGHAPMGSCGLAGELGADLPDLVAQGDDPAEPRAGETAQVLGRSPGDVDVALGHHPDG